MPARVRIARGAWLAASAIAAAAAGTQARAQDGPLSAIDWLSDSIVAPETAAAPEADAPGRIEVTPLAAPPVDAVGLLPPSATGLPRALWGPATTEEISARIAAVPDDLLPALRELFLTVLLAEASPPAADGPENGLADGPADGPGDQSAPAAAPDDRLFLARVDRLLAMGALDRAEALLARAGETSQSRFRRLFDIALLTGTETQACRRMRDLPEISPTYPARIFCLARNGDWHAAAVTLETAHTLGILSPEEDALLVRFLDPEADLAVDDPMGMPTPLTFRLLEAIGEPLSTRTLPLAFAWADLRPTRGWKAQIEAAERLNRHGGVPATVLYGIYLRQSPSASGGVWERAAAVHALQAALNAGDLATISDALVTANRVMAAAGLLPALAEQYGAELADLPLDGDAARIALRLGLASPSYRGVAAPQVAGDRGEAFLISVARGLPEPALATDTLAAAVRAGFAAATPPEAYRFLLDEGRVGEAILKAVTQFAEGAFGDTDGVADAIALLRSLGLTAHARRAALDLLLFGGRA